ncbi:hypothetical protein GPALN_014547 [Globodera pallida]|nr:hypothetical protein GPALN_014547 [Globodera pallida]
MGMYCDFRAKNVAKLQDANAYNNHHNNNSNDYDNHNNDCSSTFLHPSFGFKWGNVDNDRCSCFIGNEQHYSMSKVGLEVAVKCSTSSSFATRSISKFETILLMICQLVLAIACAMMMSVEVHLDAI